MKILSILKKDLLLVFKDRGELISLFLLPLVFIIPISYAFPKDGYNLDADVKPLMPVINYDRVAGGGLLAASTSQSTALPIHTQELLDFVAEGFTVETDFDQAMIDRLGLTADAACAQPGAACDEAVAREMVRRSWRQAALVIPRDFSAAIDAGQPMTLTLLYDPAGDAIGRQVLEAVMTGGAMQLSVQNQVFSGFDQFNDLISLAPQEIRDEIEADRAATEAETTGQQPALSVTTLSPSNSNLAVRPDTYQQTIPGYTVMFVFFLITYISGAIQAERNGGTFRRLLHMPVDRSVVLGGKLLAAFVIGLVQVGIMFGVGHFLFGMGLGQDPLALLLMTAALVFAAVGIGLAAAAFGLENVLTIPLIIAALIGGCMFPADWLPPVVQSVSLAIPHTWAMNGFQAILVRGQGLVEILPSIAVLLAFALIFFIIAVRRLEFE
ncbi:MAG: ABC transporter permease [Caldilineaceae bacterium]|nr:ABC transporter permease [Caldilineaceae bacterium]